MNDLYQIIHTLNSSEKKSLHYFLKCTGTQPKSNIKVAELYKILENRKKAPTPEELIKKLKLKDKNTLNVYKYRLKQKILDFIILENNIERIKSEDKLNYFGVKLRKKIAQFNYLFRNKGTLRILECELNTLINECIKYEIYNIAIDALIIKKQLYTRRKGLKEYYKTSKKIDLLQQTLNVINKGFDFQNYFLAQLEIKNNQREKELIIELRNILFELNKDVNQFPSALIKYLIYKFENYYYTLNEDFNTAREVCIANLSLIQKSPSLLNQQRIGTTYIDIYTNDINLKEYKRALNNIKFALKYFPKQSFNYYKTIETRFMVNCYLKKFSNASIDLKHLEKLITNKDVVQQNSILYYKAYMYFIKNDFKKANLLLNKKINLTEDIERKDVYFKFLQILLNLALDKKILAIQQCENLERYLKRKPLNENQKRTKLLFKLLKNLANQNFSDITLNKTLIKILYPLKSENKLKWQPLSPELCPIDDWLINYFKLEHIEDLVLDEKIGLKAI
ncbi:MAG: hypothetical protein ACK4IK_11790 [Bacteroidia bacterium]